MGQGHVAHHRPVGVGPRREPQIHGHKPTTIHLSEQTKSSSSCYHVFGSERALRAHPKPPTSTYPKSITIVCPRTAERGFNFEVDDVDAWWARLGSSAEVVEPLFDTPYGSRKFTIHDPDGNELGFVQANV